MKNKINNAVENRIKKWFKDYQVDEDVLDWRSVWDNSLETKENMIVIKQMIEELASSKDNVEKDMTDFKKRKKTITNEKEEKQRIDLMNLRKEEEHTQEQFKKSIEKIKFESTQVLDKAFYTTKKIVETLTKSKHISGLIIKGESGLGKSYTCLKVFNEMGLKEGIDYDILASYSTPLELYNFLYYNREGKILLLDDIMKIFENELNIGILLSALWGEGERRVHYHSTSPRLQIPPSFIFNSKIIWCLNKLPKELENIKSRCFFYNLDFNYKEKIMLLYELAKIKKIPIEIVDFIHSQSDEMTSNLDFRLLLKVYDIYQNNKDWKEIAKPLLKKNEKLSIAKKLLMSGAYMKEIEKEWKEQTGLSPRQFRRYRKVILGNKQNLS